MLSIFSRITPSILSLAIVFCWGPPCLGESDIDGIRIDLPRGGRLRVENRFGEITAETWQENYVSVAAVINNSSGRSPRSPVVVENVDKVLAVSVRRFPIDPNATVRLIVRIPADAYAEIITSEGAIHLKGLAASTSLASLSGPILAELPASANVDIHAHSANGIIHSPFGAISDKTLETRLGDGERILRIKTNSGEITLSTMVVTTAPGSRASVPPRLRSADGPGRGAGMPATAVDNEEVSEGDVIRIDAQLVTLNMSVVDRETSRGVVGLMQDDFKLFEDGAEQKILRFDSSAAPFDLILLIDMSGSTRDVVELIRAAALRFVDAARPADRIGVITFAGRAQLISPVTLNRDSLRKSLINIDTSGGDTKLYDAIQFAIDQAPRVGQASRRTAIVLMSDGLDGTLPGVFGQQGSLASYKEMLSNVREFDGVLYALWLNTVYESLHPHDTQPEAFELGYNRMKELAENGGGLFYEVQKLEDLAGAYERVVADLGTVYSLAYRPSNILRDGGWRSIRINVNRPGAVARGKRGYYAN